MHSSIYEKRTTIFLIECLAFLEFIKQKNGSGISYSYLSNGSDEAVAAYVEISGVSLKELSLNRIKKVLDSGQGSLPLLFCVWIQENVLWVLIVYFSLLNLVDQASKNLLRSIF